MKSYIQITAGRGPVECARVVYLVFKKLYKLFPDLEIVDMEKHNTEDNCYMSVIVSKDFSEEEKSELISNWVGTIKWVATKNNYRPNHKRKNWFIGINMINPVQLPDISESSISYDTTRSGGKGGQNVNKVESAVRATYVPTGLSVKCSDERSQYLNKIRAKERLLLKLYELNQEQETNKTKEIWNNHTELERGNPIQTFKGEV